jgi:hypothetical protein
LSRSDAKKGKDFPILSYPSLPLHVNKGNKSSRMRTIKTEGERWNTKEGNQKSERMNKRVTLKAIWSQKFLPHPPSSFQFHSFLFLPLYHISDDEQTLIFNA